MGDDERRQPYETQGGTYLIPLNLQGEMTSMTRTLVTMLFCIRQMPLATNDPFGARLSVQMYLLAQNLLEVIDARYPPHSRPSTASERQEKHLEALESQEQLGAIRARSKASRHAVRQKISKHSTLRAVPPDFHDEVTRNTDERNTLIGHLRGTAIPALTARLEEFDNALVLARTPRARMAVLRGEVGQVAHEAQRIFNGYFNDTLDFNLALRLPENLTVVRGPTSQAWDRFSIILRRIRTGIRAFNDAFAGFTGRYNLEEEFYALTVVQLLESGRFNAMNPYPIVVQDENEQERFQEDEKNILAEITEGNDDEEGEDEDDLI